RRADAVDFVTRIESARWGDNGDTRTNNPYTRLDWLRVRDQLLGTVGGGDWGNYFPTRTGIVLGQFISRGWYPQTDAPEISPFGGSLPINTPLTLTSPDGGAIYYTDDGSDPRTPASGEEVVEHSLVAPGSPRRGIQPTDNSDQSTWFTEAFDDGSWATGTLGAGFDSGKYNPLIDDAFDMADSVDSSAYETFYLRWEFEVADPAIFNSLSLGARFDDGYVAYLNGTEIARVNNSQTVGVPLAFDGRATSNQSDENSAQTFAPTDVSQHLGLLKAGTNVLAVHGLNSSIGSSDMLIDATLDAAEGIGGGAGGLSPTAKLYSGPFDLTDSAQIRARVFNGGEWSALTEASFIIGTVPADASNLAVTEFNYRPASPTPTELAAGHNDRSDFEFIELANISPTEKVELTGVMFVSGISFDFSEHSSIMELAPGESLLIVEDLEAFEFRYGSDLPVAGIFQNGSQLSNGGEEISISNTSLAPPDQLLRTFTYDDSVPWPTSPDGEGFSLTLIDPSSNPDHALPQNWRASVAPNGSPGGSDATTFAIWAAGFGAGLTPLGDDDDDRLANLIEYSLATSPLTPSADSAPASAMTADGLIMRFRANKAADDLITEPEASVDLKTWVAAEIISRADNGDGTETVTARAPEIADPSQRSFLRLRVTLKP
ncbi:MAG: hypothetical protein ACR2RV_16820, partial [Verrucomicrobiales bacterium]